MIEVKEWGNFWVQQITRSITSQKLDSYPPYLYEIREIFDNINLNKFDCKWIEIIIECLSIILANQRHELSEFLLKLKEPCKEIILSESAETSYKNLLASSYSSF